MLLAHAVTLAEARSYVAALADGAHTSDASVEYERVLLQLDWLHGDFIPGISPVLTDRAATSCSASPRPPSRTSLSTASTALQVELVLDMLDAARAKDVP